MSQHGRGEDAGAGFPLSDIVQHTQTGTGAVTELITTSGTVKTTGRRQRTTDN